jgi:hypothetical protein
MQQYVLETSCTEFLKFVGPIGTGGQKIMRSANYVGNAGPHVRQTFLNDEFTFGDRHYRRNWRTS